MKRQSLFSPLAVFTQGVSFIVCTAVAVNLITAAASYTNAKAPASLSLLDQKQLEYVLDTDYPERKQLISSLPYSWRPEAEKELSTATHSIMLIDADTGSIIWEKNADEEIPPASMTKLVEMYVVFDAVEKGEVSLDDEVPLPPQSWAKNLPSDASIMFLDQNQHVTLNELLLGLAIASGNDASIAVANYVCGNMQDFVQRMNDVITGLGLTHTHFVESSGYSEKNITTAREFAEFCKVYLQRFPWALEKYHSQKILQYPLEHNLPDYQKDKGDSSAVIQYNTNKLLGKLEGCDGLKTGFITESGYNLSLTAKRGNTRFLAVMMRGPGTRSAEGNKYRVADGTALMEYAFANYSDFSGNSGVYKDYSVPVTCTKDKTVNLVPVYDEKLTVPLIPGSSGKLTVTAEVPDFIENKAEEGLQYGSIVYKSGDVVLRTIPLAADRSTEAAGFGKLKKLIVNGLVKLFLMK